VCRKHHDDLAKHLSDVTARRFGSDLIAHCDEVGIATDLIDGITTAS
jgi:hypothetical protein